MLPARPWIVPIAALLLAAPGIASASDGQATASDDCFAVAAPMADATPCYEPGHRKKHQHHHASRPDPKAKIAAMAMTPIGR